MVCIIAECKKLTGEMEILNKELNEVKSQILVAEYSRESEIQHQDRKAQEEITSLQQLVHGKYKHFLIHVLSKTILPHLTLSQKQLRNLVFQSLK